MESRLRISNDTMPMSHDLRMTPDDTMASSFRIVARFKGDHVSFLNTASDKWEVLWRYNDAQFASMGHVSCLSVVYSLGFQVFYVPFLGTLYDYKKVFMQTQGNLEDV